MKRTLALGALTRTDSVALATEACTGPPHRLPPSLLHEHYLQNPFPFQITLPYSPLPAVFRMIMYTTTDFSI
ncbi:uncharacterized protein SCHCODRAFT_02634331, partial [Schizophyllum commune H4-8]|uniref:uncharacterized protein n=1 Tax=Schizophyllum commune (strain H4-8 / FGSC 9210) TaxID=578458 RepID=UPI00215FF058